jgi:peptide subunit release factor 1 (eRF1)
VTTDRHDASGLQLALVLAPLIEGVERTQERALLARFEASDGAAEPAAVGLDDVISMLARGNVDVLLIAQGASFTAGLCPHCGSLSANAARCKRDGTDLASVDAITRAVDQGADIVIVNHKHASLHERGSIAALPKPTHDRRAVAAATPAGRRVAVS